MLESDEQNRLIVHAVQATVPDVVAVYRFGSTVNGVVTSESDIDIAVLARDRISPAAWFDLQDDLTSRLGCEVDLLDLATASPVLTIQVVARGHRLFEGSRAECASFEAHALGAYARFNEERRGILERIAREGTVYGR